AGSGAARARSRRRPDPAPAGRGHGRPFFRSARNPDIRLPADEAAVRLRLSPTRARGGRADPRRRRRVRGRGGLSSPAAVLMRLLVLGGTKFLGRAVVQEALARGHDVTLFNRGRTNPELFPGAEKIRGDRTKDFSALAGRSWDAALDMSTF